jgi:FAD/FMN-containing dehydrogenase
MDADISSQSIQGIATFEERARAIVSIEHVRTATATDIVAGVQPQLIVEPGTEQELAKILKLANEASLAVIPRGGGTKF